VGNVGLSKSRISVVSLDALCFLNKFSSLHLLLHFEQHAGACKARAYSSYMFMRMFGGDRLDNKKHTKWIYYLRITHVRL